MFYIPNTGFYNKPFNAMNNFTTEVSRFRLNADRNGFGVMELRTGDKACTVPNWQKGAAKPRDLERPHPYFLNTGILCAGLRIVDIDCDDPNIVSAIEDLTRRFLGDAPCRSRANSARKAFLYRAFRGEPRKRSVTSNSLVNLDGKPSKVEVLGAGQFVHVHGIHPSGTPLIWQEGSPAETPLGALSDVEEVHVRAFLKAVAALIDAEAPPRGRGVMNGKGNTIDPFGLNGGIAPGGPVSIARLENLLDQIGSHPSRPFAVYDTWVQVCCLPIAGMIRRSQIDRDDGVALMKRISERHG